MSKLKILREVLEAIQKAQPIEDTNVMNTSNQAGGESVNFIEETQEEKEITTLSRNFAKALNDRNYEHLDGRAEYHLYTVDHLIKLIKNNDEENTKKLLTENKIKSKFEDCEFISLEFNDDRMEAEVVCNVRIRMVEATENYLKTLNKKNNKKNQISAGNSFRTTYKLVVKNEKGCWKIDKFETSEENLKIDSK